MSELTHGVFDIRPDVKVDMKQKDKWKPSKYIEQCQADCRMWRKHYYKAEEFRVELTKRIHELERQLAQVRQ